MADQAKRLVAVKGCGGIEWVSWVNPWLSFTGQRSGIHRFCCARPKGAGREVIDNKPVEGVSLEAGASPSEAETRDSAFVEIGIEAYIHPSV